MIKLTRKNKLILNSSVGLFAQIISMACGFILPSAILSAYGSKAYGLMSSINQFLGFIQLCELGVGAVVQSALYKPLADNDTYQVDCILKSSRKFFRTIGTILFVYVIGLCVFYPLLINDYEPTFVILMIVALSVDSFSNYYLGMNNSLLLQADQRVFIPLGAQAIATLINTVVSLILIKFGVSLLFVKYSTAAIFLLKPLVLFLVVRKNYEINYDVKYEVEPIQQKWNGLAQHFASVVVDHTDVVVLTAISTLENVSIYSIYYLVVSSLRTLITSSLNGVQATMGNMIAKKEYDLLDKFFNKTEWVVHTAIIILFTVTSILITPFVLLYTRNIHDANYNVPLFSALIVVANAGFCLQNIYKMVVKAAGHYKETQTSSIIEAIINVVSSIVLVSKFGLVGVAIGTILAMSYRLLYHVWYMKYNIIYRLYKPFIKQCIVDIIIIFVSVLIFEIIPIKATSYIYWILSGILVFSITAIISFVINFLFYKENLCNLMYSFVRMIKNLFGKVI